MYEYAPYTDTTLYPPFDISAVTIVDCFTLGFIVSDADSNPSWGGHYSIESDFYQNILSRLRLQKKRIICSFGGADGNELATTITCSEELYEKYKSVIERYGFTSIDFDIEGGAIGDRRSIDRRAEAILRLQKQFPDLYISVTLPATPEGLDEDGLYVVQTTPCDLVNIMAMDYGTNTEDMGQAACDAASATRKQTGKLIGVTAMIGRNDTGEIFTIADAYTLKEFQQRNSWIKRLSIWAIERDHELEGDLNESSQIDQAPLEFSKILL